LKAIPKEEEMSEIPPVSFSMVITHEDYSRAQALYNARGSNAKITYLDLGKIKYLVLILIVIASAAFHFFTSNHTTMVVHRSHTLSGNAISIVISIGVSIVVFVALFVGFWIFIMRQARRNVSNEQYDFTIDDTGIRVHTPTVDTCYAWSGFTDPLENEHLFLLVKDANYLFLLKRAIADPEDVNRLRVLIEHNLGPVNSKGMKSMPTPSGQE
jgi:hypothetical protein